VANADPDNPERQRALSVFYNKIGDVLVAQGNLTAALKSFRDEFATADRLAKADPGNAEWQRDLSVSYRKIGNVLVDQGNHGSGTCNYAGKLGDGHRTVPFVMFRICSYSFAGR
jgi:hypothetical protein